MGIHVIQSQQIDVLVQGVLLRTQKPSKHPFAVLKTEHFVVPSPAIETWLTQTLAEQQGISANSQFHQRIRGFQWYCYQQVLDDKDHVRRANIPRLMMKWRIYQSLKSFIEMPENPLDQDHPLYGIIHRIYDSAAQLEHGVEKQLKKQSMLYWVSEQVSKLFSNYMIYRGYCQKGCGDQCHCPTNWLNVWGQNQSLDLENLFQKNPDQDVSFKFAQAQELESWQRWLWQHTFHDDFVEMQGIDIEFWQVLDDPEQREQALKKLPSQAIIFTVLDLPPSQLQFLRRLGQYIDVLILHYNPSQEYWADSVDPNWKKRYDLSVKERFIAKHPQATDEQIEQFFQAFTLNFNAEVRESRHPLLTRFGKQARDHFSILSHLSSGEEGQWVDAFVDEFPAHLLGKLQSDILYLVEPEQGGYVLNEQDDSIQIHVCHSALRQLEVLKEQLIHWLSQGTAEQPRRPSDILVIAPDLKQIEPLIRSVFPQSSHQDGMFLPVKIAGVTQIDVNNAWRAVLGRIQWVNGRFSIEDFADWLNLSATQMRYGLDLNMTERMIELLIQAGFKRGLDEAHLQQSLSQDDTDYRFSFKFALDRLALGIAIPEHAIFADTLSYARVLPSDFELIARLIEIYEDFAKRRDWMLEHEQQNLDFTQADQIPSAPKKRVEQWLEILKKEIEEFQSAGVDALQTVYQIVSKQYTMLTLSYNYAKDTPEHHELQDMQLPLPYLIQEIQDTLDNQIEQALPTGQITFSQIGHIRPVPYALVVVLNLDSGKFPNRNTQLPFDLMSLLRPQLGDRSRLEDDQGAFLDALLLARENLWLFYNGFDVSDGEVRDPSSVLQELISHLAFICAPKIPQDELSVHRMVSFNGIEVPEQIQQLYHVHPLQPFDPMGFVASAQSESSASSVSDEPSFSNLVRYQDQWFEVASQIRHATGQREPWVNQELPNQEHDVQVLDAGQWIQDVTFPARLYLKTLGVENLKPEDLPADEEPLILDGLGRYQIREFLQQQEQLEDLDFNLLQDQMPVGKVQQSSLQISLAEQHSLRQRLQRYADTVTQTTQRQWRIRPDLVMNLIVPQQLTEQWVSLDASSARAKRRVKVWLEYLLWLCYLKSCHPDISDEKTAQLQRIAIFSDATLINTGVTATQAQAYVQSWLQTYAYAQTQPLVLPAALLGLLAEKGKELEWESDEFGRNTLANFKELQKEWEKSDSFLPFSLNDMEWSKQHRDWQFILQEQDTTALLKHACDQFAYALYQPFYQYQTVVEE
ncbi:exodeoxyribonuclease V subunit gamma [Acinetobacter shaoyimingii]|uniref:RecBCD enzyme subunit RecC n=1 Tax=Acinetobacter shaoyimingii TaxID=2715164 RepID=A0A6G8RS61_9GAMM|nr:exodeoxyribonuclease V subunit gamma [Acinetobacter shaoyimingii]QIO04766.1 exodeoxyribonuclease V subunit gamma [Acinetobacter shaoyimingii]